MKISITVFILSIAWPYESYGYLNLADSYDFQEWNFEKNGFNIFTSRV